MISKKIDIFGAGISGLVAAIRLSRDGYRVFVHEKRAAIGGPPQWHPSVHQQLFDLEKTSEYIGIDVSPCFFPVNSHTFYLYGRKHIILNPKDNYVCLKGGIESSIEKYLYSKALDCGVEFSFDQSLDIESIQKLMNSDSFHIIATGLEKETYDALGIRHITVHGFRASGSAGERPHASSFLGEYTNHEFAYFASSGDLRFALLFARGVIGKRSLDAFRKHLCETENIIFDNWQFSTGAIPLENNLVKNGLVLSGTLSGMIDPFSLNGISGALISGRIASMYFQDPNKALIEFNRFTKNFHLKSLIRRFFVTMPFRKIFLLPVLYINNRFKTVGVI